MPPPPSNPPLDFSAMSDEELEHLATSGEVDFSGMSDAELEAIASGASDSPLSASPLRGAGGLGATDEAQSYNPDTTTPTREEMQARQRFFLESMPPLIAGALLGPEAAPVARAGIAGARGIAALAPELQVLVRAAMMALAGGAGAEAGRIVDPEATPEEGQQRVATGALLGAGGQMGGEVLGQGLRGLAGMADEGGNDLLRRGLGFIKSNLRRLGPNGVQRGNQIAARAYDTGQIGAFTGEQELARRFSQVARDAGQELGDLRAVIDASATPRVPIGNVVHEIDQATANWRPGISDESILQRNLNNSIQDAIAHSDGQLEAGMGDLADLKEIFARRSAFHAAPNPSSRGVDLVEPNRAARGVVQGAEEGQAQLAESLGEITPEQLQQFFGNKELYGAMAELIDPSYGSLIDLQARNAGNSMVGLMPTLMAAGRGDLPSAIATLIASRGISQRGAQATGVGLKELSKGLGLAGSPEVSQFLGQAGAQSGHGLGIANEKRRKTAQ